MPMSIGRMRLGEHVRGVCATMLGILLAAVPVALWVAWTPALLGWILLAALVSAALLVMLTESTPAGAQRPAYGGSTLPENFAEEVHRISPLIYHHSGRNSSRFRNAMRRLAHSGEGSGSGETPR